MLGFREPQGCLHPRVYSPSSSTSRFAVTLFPFPSATTPILIPFLSLGSQTLVSPSSVLWGENNNSQKGEKNLNLQLSSVTPI